MVGEPWQSSVTYDQQANAAYIYLVDPVQATKPDLKVAHMYTCDPIKVDGMINLDFDREGQAIGIEVLDARAKLPRYLLDAAERLDA
ncbi:DUF2283 domain-containing protein [Actinomadura sp. LOL_016]|uniref:DUF2283 domain-containing protein n=1 Tax=unclassified Actinomadura TaxID=2626254 RepID=UPI003A7F768A